MIKLPEALGVKVHLNSVKPGISDRPNQLTIPAEQDVSIAISWSPTQSGTLHDSLHFQWKKAHLHVALSGKATAPPPSALMYAAVKRTVSDIGDTPLKANSALPHTPTGQKVVKSQRVGGISPGHPTFEAAMRNSTAATPARRRAGDTPGLSRYAIEAAPDAAQAPAFADRLNELAGSPKHAPPERSRVRLRRCAGTVPLRSLRISVNQQPDAAPSVTALAKPAFVSAVTKAGEPVIRAGSSKRSGSLTSKTFSFFHSGYGCSF